MAKIGNGSETASLNDVADVTITSVADNQVLQYDAASGLWKNVTNLTLPGTLGFAAGTTINEFSTDTTLAGDSDDAVPTEKAVKAYAESVADAAQTAAEATAEAYADDKDSMTVDAEPSSDLTASGLKVSMTAGESLAAGDVCYLKSDGKMWKADADDTDTYPALALALATISADASGEFLLKGFFRDDSYTNTVGGSIYLDTTAGGITQTAPSDTDDVIQVLGVATHADRIYFKPDLTYVTHA